MRPLRVAIAQIDATVGDLDGNAEKIVAFHARAVEQGADLVTFPELALCGYPPEDLVLQRAFLDANRRVLRSLAPRLKGAVAVVGFVEGDDDHRYNAAAVTAGGKIRGIYRKQALPNYGVFDEARTFTPGRDVSLFDVAGVRVAITICEDLWVADGPVAHSAAAGAECIVNINASPFHRGKGFERQVLVHQRAVDHQVAIVFAQTVGGQDELVFDGDSLIYAADGRLHARGSQFEEDLILCDLSFPARVRKLGRGVEPIACSKPSAKTKPPAAVHIPRRVRSPQEEVYSALLLGVRDYCRKNRFPGAIVGMSGGIDSALTATIAADALGPEHVLGVAMPSAISAQRSLEDAKEVATNLGIDFQVIPVRSLVEPFEATLAEAFGAGDPGLALENIQSRIRGTLLMALSNESGRIVLTTGNKSEYAVGYATLYGDTAGGFAVLKDVPKTLVYELAAYRNAYGLTAIPDQVFTRPPTAELRPGQEDTDSLPPYEILDPILEAYVEQRATAAQIIASGFERGVVEEVIRLVDRSEYKRRQTPPGVKITPLGFGRDRRMPITNRFSASPDRSYT